MKAHELRELSPEELQHKPQELIEELLNLRFQLATGQIENVGRIAAVRRDIARMRHLDFRPPSRRSCTGCRIRRRMLRSGRS